MTRPGNGNPIGPVPVAITALGTATERSPGATSTVMPSTVLAPAGSVSTRGVIVTVS